MDRRRPLLGKTAVITRPESQARELAAALRRFGARVVLTPMIKILPPSRPAGLDTALRKFSGYDAVVFSSANGVEAFFARARTLRLRLTRPPRVFSVGPATAAALRRRGWSSRTPKIHKAEDLARTLGKVEGLRILFPRAKEGRDILPKLLRRNGARVSLVEAYRTVRDPEGPRRFDKAARSGTIDVVAFTSPSTVTHLVAHLKGKARPFFLTAKAAAIGPVTGAALRRYGIRPAIVAPSADGASLARAVSDLFRDRSRK